MDKQNTNAGTGEPSTDGANQVDTDAARVIAAAADVLGYAEVSDLGERMSDSVLDVLAATDAATGAAIIAGVQKTLPGFEYIGGGLLDGLLDELWHRMPDTIDDPASLLVEDGKGFRYTCPRLLCVPLFCDDASVASVDPARLEHALRRYAGTDSHVQVYGSVGYADACRLWAQPWAWRDWLSRSAASGRPASLEPAAAAWLREGDFAAT